jgi:hypothetical protein
MLNNCVNSGEAQTDDAVGNPELENYLQNKVGDNYEKPRIYGV